MIQTLLTRSPFDFLKVVALLCVAPFTLIYCYSQSFNLFAIALGLVLLTGFYFLDFKWKLLSLVAVSYMPGHQLLPVLSVTLFLSAFLLEKGVRISGFEILILVTAIISLVLNSGRVLPFIVYGITAWYWLFFYKWISNHTISQNTMKAFILALLAFQILQVPFFIKTMSEVGLQSIGDAYRGSLLSNNFYLVGKTITAMVLCGFLYLASKKLRYLALLLAFIFCWLLMSLKMSVPIVALVFVAFLLVSKTHVVIKLIPICLVPVALYFGMTYIDSDFGMIADPFWWIGKIAKVQIIAEAAENLRSDLSLILFGYGPGMFMARSAVALTGGLDTWYSLPLLKFESIQMKEIIYLFYTPSIMEQTSGSILYSPNSSVFALFFEFGIIGFILMLCIGIATFVHLLRSSPSRNILPFNWAVHHTLVFLIMVLFPLSMLDYWFDYSTVILPLVVFYRYSTQNSSNAHLTAHQTV